MTAAVLKHPARIVRAWQIVDEGDGTFAGYLRPRSGKVEAQTERGALHLVRDAIEHAQRYRGVPVWPRIVQRQREAL
jgi:hypothetical protein